MNNKINIVKTATTTIIVIMFAILLVLIDRNPVLSLEFLLNEKLNAAINYQITVLGLAGLMILLIIGMTGKKSIKLLNIAHLDGAIIPERFIGINPKKNETWKNLGLNFAIVISLVTAIVIYFQVYRNQEPSLVLFPNLLLVILLALSNSFVEEVIFRFSFAAVIISSNQSYYLAQGLSALTFGGIHYFGVPSGIPGVLMAGFIGWFLTKSILETRSFFWAWLIHFIQDVIIMFGLYMMIS